MLQDGGKALSMGCLWKEHGRFAQECKPTNIHHQPTIDQVKYMYVVWSLSNSKVLLLLISMRKNLSVDLLGVLIV